MKSLAFILIVPFQLFMSWATKSTTSYTTKEEKAVSSTEKNSCPLDVANFKRKPDKLLTLEMAA